MCSKHGLLVICLTTLIEPEPYEQGGLIWINVSVIVLSSRYVKVFVYKLLKTFTEICLCEDTSHAFSIP